MEIEKTVSERDGRYGGFANVAEVAQDLQDVMRGAPGWAGLSKVQKQALTDTAGKVARILCGDPNYIDNWHDIQGYSRLVEEDIRNPRQVVTLGPVWDRGK